VEGPRIYNELATNTRVPSLPTWVEARAP